MSEMKKKPEKSSKQLIEELCRAVEASVPEDQRTKYLNLSMIVSDEFPQRLQEILLNKVADECYQIAKDHGFHEGETIGVVPIERLAMFISNLHGECSELWEAGRKGKLMEPCDKDPSLCNLEEELADIVIRAFDTAVSYGVNIGEAILKKSKYNESRPWKHNKKA